MSRKIIGVTVGTTLPKPSFDQTDPTKGDYIRGDRSFLTMDETLTQTGRPADAKATGDAISLIQTKIDELANNSSNGSAIEYTATISTDWTLENDIYTQTIQIAGMLAADDGIVGLVISEDYETSQSQLSEWAKIHRITTADGAITVYATEPTTMELNIQMLATRDGVVETDIFDGAMLLNGSVTHDKLANETITPDKVSNAARTQYFEIAVGTEWTGDAAPYSQSIAVDGLLEADKAVVRFVAPDAFENLEVQQEAFALLYSAESADGSITLFSKEKPTVEFTVVLEVARI